MVSRHSNVDKKFKDTCNKLSDVKEQISSFEDSESSKQSLSIVLEDESGTSRAMLVDDPRIDLRNSLYAKT